MTGTPPSAPVMATPAATPTAVAPTASIPADACRLSNPATVTAPAGLVQSNGQIAGLTDQGELLVLQSHVPGVGDTVSIFDPASGVVTPVISRPPPASVDDATSQIDASITGNADWVVWEESGFYIEQADWHMWVFDRHTHEVREIDSFDARSDGKIAPGWASDVSLLGGVAVWAAPVMLGPNTTGSRIYVADLRAKTVRRLDFEANYPSLLSADELRAAMKTTTDPASGNGLAQPVTISLHNGTATPETWIAPTTILAAASSSAGAVVVRLLANSATEDPTTKADVVTHDPTGQTRTFKLTDQWGPVAAGPGFLIWTDYSHIWIQPSGQIEPTMLLDARPDAVRFFVNRSFVFWHTDRNTDQYDWTATRLAKVTCP
jgi:hypothetical protein